MTDVNGITREIDIKISNLTDIAGRVTADEVVSWLERRLLQGECYTWAGLALVAINAKQDHIDDLFSEKVKKYFRENLGKGAWEPHVYAVAARCCHRLVNGMGKTHQAVVISGDSGSGKTFSASHMLSLLLSVTQHPAENLRQIWTSVSVLMSLGNAQSECNDNSSRFGKLVQLQYLGGEIRGAVVDTFLLEKTRVSYQGRNQRNFHIFYQLLAGLSEAELRALQLSRDGRYAILPGARVARDAEDCVTTRAAMTLLGMDWGHVTTLLAGVVHLGDVGFAQGDADAAVVAPGSVGSLQSACALLGLSVASVTRLLTSSLVAPRRRTAYHVPMSVSACAVRRDCLLRFLYEKLFHWAVRCVNTRLRAHVQQAHTIGLLDIFGFESFQTNSLEQLCINYANERLHDVFVTSFIQHARAALQAELEEALPECSVLDTLALLHGPPLCLFALINEASQLGRGASAQALQERIYSCLHGNASLVSPRYAAHAPCFTVQHYAGQVTYELSEMREKNADKLPAGLEPVLAESNNPFLGELLAAHVHTTNRQTVIDKYQSSLDRLLRTLGCADLHFVRCVRASRALRSGGVEAPYLAQQLRSSGVLDLIPISCHRFRRFPYWFSAADFLSRYQALLTRDSASCADTLELLIQNHPVMRAHVRLGRHSVFVSEAGMSQLAACQQAALVAAAGVMQRAWRRRQQQQAAAGSRHAESEPAVQGEVKAKRHIFIGDAILSRLRLAEVPVRFHTRATVLLHSHCLPISELPRGLPDAI